MISIEQTISNWQDAREKDIELGRAHSGNYDKSAHHAAIDVTSKWANRMINHPDWTVELANKYYANALEDIAYPLSC